MNNSSGEEDSDHFPNDEVREIKRAMRVAKARKRALSQQMKTKLDKSSADQCELESMLRKQSADLNKTKTQLSQADFDLREARFELNRVLERENSLKEEKKLNDAKNAAIISDLRGQLESKNRSQEEKSHVAVFECDKLIKTLSSLYRSVFDDRGGNTTTPKTSKQLFDKTMRDAESLREFLKSKSSSMLTEEQERVATNEARHNIINPSNGCDNALLDMCRSLEEENRSLSDTAEALRVQLAETSRDASINRLIPHYRLAIVRSRTYAANLLEQIKREQANSQSLREQLDATYADLKIAVEEKRALFSRMSKYSLQLEEQQSYAAHHKNIDEERILRGSSVSSVGGVGTSCRAPLPSAECEDSSSRSSGDGAISAKLDHSTGKGGLHDDMDEHHHMAEMRAQSKYLQSLGEGSMRNTYSGERERNRDREAMTENKQQEGIINSNSNSSSNGISSVPNASAHLKAELSQLDREIEELKVKLGKAAMLKSQQMLNEVLASHAHV